MRHRVITRTTELAAERLAAAVDQALGLPADPTHRGYLCPPAPFGRTERWSYVYQRGSDGLYLIDAPPDSVDGARVTVGGVPITIDLGESEVDDGSDRARVQAVAAART